MGIHVSAPLTKKIEEETETVALRDDAYEQLRRRIITRKLEPGAVLTQEEIASELGMSRTPVREALSRLQDEGLLKHVPRRGFSVVEMTVSDLVGVASLIRALQQFVITELLAQGQDYDTTMIRQLHEEQKKYMDDPWRCFELNIEMHIKVVELYKNRRLVEIGRRMGEQIMMAGFISSSPDFEKALNETFSEHDAIVDALEARDLDAVIEALRAHDEGLMRRISGGSGLRIG